jgi:hypothetical protein
MEFELEILYKASLPANIIPREVMSRIRNHLRDSPNDQHNFISRVLSADIGDWSREDNPWMKWVTDKYSWNGTTYSGKWMTRFKKLLKVKNDHELSDEMSAFLGSEFGKFQTDKNYFFRLTRWMDWKPGDFSERDGQSCWWSEKNYNRVGFAALPTSYAVQFYESQEQFEKFGGRKGIGRCWLLVHERKWYIFNAYGVSLSDIANILASTFGKKSKLVSVESDHAYINQGNLNNEGRQGGGVGRGYVIADELPDADADGTHKLPNFSTTPLECSECGIKVRPSEAYIADKEVVCSDCIVEHFHSCLTCGTYHRKERMTSIWSSRYDEPYHICPYHKESSPSAVCSVHGTLYPGERTYRAWHTNLEYCDTCERQGHVATCTSCGHVVNNYRILTVGRHSQIKFCVPCSKKLTQTIMEKPYGHSHQLRRV